MTDSSARRVRGRRDLVATWRPAPNALGLGIWTMDSSQSRPAEDTGPLPSYTTEESDEPPLSRTQSKTAVNRNSAKRADAVGRAGIAASSSRTRRQGRVSPNSGRRHPVWADVADDHWNDWRWQMQNAIRSTSQLAELIVFTPDEQTVLEELEGLYKLSIPPYYFSLINPGDPDDPIRIQSVPSPLEMTSQSGQELEDPLDEEKDCPVPGLTHRYPDRALLVTTPVCSMYCRFCTRKRVTMDREGWDGPSRDEQRMIEYIQEHQEIHDCIVSGGDPLMLPSAKLRWFLEQLSAIDHVDVIRIGTRVPVTLPQKLFDPQIVDLLAESGKVWIQTHFNHPVEMTPESAQACRNLVRAGMPVNNHSVLLRGVNDSVATMRTLVRTLLRNKVRPYYIFHCDPVVGSGHLRTSIWKGIEIIEGLRGHVSGLGVPTYVVDGLHGAGKIPIMPNYMVSASENAVVLRNYEGMLFRYAPEDRAESVPEGIASVGVSNLLSGTGSVLAPEGTPRIERRRQRERKSLEDNSCGGPPENLYIISLDANREHGRETVNVSALSSHNESLQQSEPAKRGRRAASAVEKSPAHLSNGAGGGNRTNGARRRRLK